LVTEKIKVSCCPDKKVIPSLSLKGTNERPPKIAPFSPYARKKLPFPEVIAFLNAVGPSFLYFRVSFLDLITFFWSHSLCCFVN
jgi:hypothetical protein